MLIDLLALSWSDSISYLHAAFTQLCLRGERTLEESISLEWFTDQSSTNYWRLLSPSGWSGSCQYPTPFLWDLLYRVRAGLRASSAYVRIFYHFLDVQEGITVIFPRFYGNLWQCINSHVLPSNGYPCGTFIVPVRRPLSDCQLSCLIAG